MEQAAEPPLLNHVLLESAKFSFEERRSRIKQCVASGRHDPSRLAVCITPSRGPVRYCDHCWSVIDGEGLTWSWAPSAP